jgi:CHASE2 domain-containing sensor protein
MYPAGPASQQASTSTSTGCISSAKLAEYAHAELASEEVATLEAHLAECPSCFGEFVDQDHRSLLPSIPNCRVVQEIGRGRFGVVYKAWWLSDHPKIVALKLLSSAGQMEQDRFDREVAVLKRIDSPGIVKCLESGCTEDAKYYIMDYVEGVHLDEYLASTSHDMHRKLAVFQQVCRAVADAHAQGVTHRDLKPSNILVDASDRPHILDFGICGVDPSDWSSWERCTITHPGDVVGTLKYMSPEQAWGGVAGPVDERSDIWSLGVMLYGIVTDGDYPYSVRSTRDKPAPEALLERIRKELPRLPKLESLPRGRELEILLERCLAWEPDQRLRSAARLADDLDRYLNSRRINTRPLWFPYRLRRLAVGAATRSRWMFAAFFIAAVGAALWVAPFLTDIAWRVPGDQFAGGAARSAALGGTGGAQDSMLIVGVFDGTLSAVVDFAAQRGFEDVTADVRSWRAVHGHFLERLAAARPRGVVWDYYFRSPQPGDARLALGVQALEGAGIPVVLAASKYDQDGQPELSPGLTSRLGERIRHGAISARDMVQRPGEFVIAAKDPGGTAVPSLALTALAALLHPEAALDLDWPGRQASMDLLYRTGPASYLRERDRVALTRVFEAGKHQAKYAPEDLLACNKFNLQRPDQWQRRTVPYQALLTCNDEELRQRVDGKLVIVGDHRTRNTVAFPDRHRVKYGASTVSDVPGCYLLADAIAGLLSRNYLKAANPLPATTFLSMLCVAALGCVLPIKLANTELFDEPHYRVLLWLALLSIAAGSLFLIVLTREYATVHLGMAGFCLSGPMAGAFAVEFARNRHRVLDRNRQAIEDVGLDTRGTITVTPQRTRSHLATG